MRILIALITILMTAAIAFAGTHSCTGQFSGIQGCSEYRCSWTSDGSVPNAEINSSGGAIVQVSTIPDSVTASYNLTFKDDYGYEILENRLDGLSTTSAEEFEFAPSEIFTGKLTIENSATASGDHGRYKFIICH